jgi:phospholipid/cholesterol/gamma-HCH transport system substrate-binding protein
MASGPRILWSQLRIGILTTLFFTAVSLSIFFIDQVRDSIEDRYTLYFHTFTLQTIQPRAPVWLAGIPVGNVVGLDFLPPATDSRERLRVVLSINAAAQPFITEGAAAQVITSGLLGEAVVNVLPASEPGAPLSDRSELRTARGLDPTEVTHRLEAVYDSVGPVVARWDEVLNEARHGQGTLPRLIRKPEDIAEFRRDLLRLEAMFDTISIAAGKFRGFAEDPAIREAVGRLAPRLAETAKRWQESQGSIQGFAQDSVLSSHLETIGATVERLARRLEDGRGTLGRMLNDRILSQELARTRELLSSLKSELENMKM